MNRFQELNKQLLENIHAICYDISNNIKIKCKKVHIHKYKKLHQFILYFQVTSLGTCQYLANLRLANVELLSQLPLGSAITSPNQINLLPQC